METWFNTVQRIEALEAAARSWIGTPFVANSRVKGPRGGTCCHMLAEQLYLEAGYPLAFRVPAGSMKWSDISKSSLIEQFFDTQIDIFEQVEPAPESFQALEEKLPMLGKAERGNGTLPGDVVGFKIGGCVHHVGVVLSRGQFVHCMRGVGTKISNLNDPTYALRMEKTWRARA